MSGPSPAYQVENKNNQRYNQEKMNKSAGNMEAETQKPQNENDYKDCPKHK